MRVFVLPVLVLSLSFLKSYSQDSVLLNMTLRPQKVYREQVRQDFQMEMNYDSSSQAIKDALNASGQLDQLNSKRLMIMETVTETGRAGVGNRMPVIMEVTKDSVSPGPAVIPPGTKFYGSAILGQTHSFDSIAGEGIDEQTRKTLLQTISGMLAQISLPQKKMAVGDSYTQTMPLKLPVAGMNISMNLSIVYTLVSATAATGNFNMQAKILMSVEDLPVPVIGGGEGEGSLVYDRANEFPSSYRMDFTIRVGIKKDDLNLRMTMKSRAERSCVVSSH
jgi:hypothetical protein